VYVGLRDVDSGEREIIKRLGIRAFSMRDVDAYGIATVVKDAISHISPTGREALHMSFDIDSLDPDVAPSTGTAVPGGLSLREGRYICETIHATGRLRSMDLVEVNPSICAGKPEKIKRTLDAACTVICSALGSTLL
jgi:arginase